MHRSHACVFVDIIKCLIQRKRRGLVSAIITRDCEYRIIHRMVQSFSHTTYEGGGGSLYEVLLRISNE